jgi:L-amino acid N-acyltransferase YncA
MSKPFAVRAASSDDLEAIRRIYNEGIEDRVATLDREPKSREEIAQWWSAHDGRYAILVATESDDVIGWASLNPFSQRCAHENIADLSVYVARHFRGRGAGYVLLTALAQGAAKSGFHKIVLHALDSNEPGSGSTASRDSATSASSRSTVPSTAATWTSWPWNAFCEGASGVTPRPWPPKDLKDRLLSDLSRLLSGRSRAWLCFETLGRAGFEPA